MREKTATALKKMITIELPHYAPRLQPPSYSLSSVMRGKMDFIKK